jgi:hypothetical protein
MESAHRLDPNKQRCLNVFARTHFGLIFWPGMCRSGQRARPPECPSCPPRAQPTEAHCLIFPLPLNRRAPPAQTPTLEMDAAAAASASAALASLKTTEQLV